MQYRITQRGVQGLALDYFKSRSAEDWCLRGTGTSTNHMFSLAVALTGNKMIFSHCLNRNIFYMLLVENQYLHASCLIVQVDLQTLGSYAQITGKYGFIKIWVYKNKKKIK